MGSIAVIVPVKGKNPKSRLSTILNPFQRRQLLVAMLEDLLQAIIRAKMIQDTFIVSADREVLRFAERYGANSVEEDEERGVNSAVKTGMEKTRGYDGCLILPADIPFITARDIRSAISLYNIGALVISPSEDRDGTNLLLLKMSIKFDLHYDDDSFNKHVNQAVSNTIPVAIYYSERIAFDMDRGRDISRAFRIGGRCSTMTFLARTMKDRFMIKERECGPPGKRHDKTS
jgi:2-phospho-L-lactate guanylyltransferase